MVTVLGGVVALVVLLMQTWRLRRDVRALALFLAWIGSIWNRERFDAFDITWLLLVVIAAALTIRRAGAQAAG